MVRALLPTCSVKPGVSVTDSVKDTVAVMTLPTLQSVPQVPFPDNTMGVEADRVGAMLSTVYVLLVLAVMGLLALWLVMLSPAMATDREPWDKPLKATSYCAVGVDPTGVTLAELGVKSVALMLLALTASLNVYRKVGLVLVR
jgi:hypothetical protein